MARIVSVLAFAFLFGCQTVAEVDVEISEDGSGTVTVAVVLDPEAAAAIGGSEGLALGDLEGTGWTVTGPDPTEDGGLAVSAAHGFANAQELAAVLDMIAGPGVFDDVTLEIEEPFGRTEWDAGLEVAVTGDPGQFSDESLTEVLSGLPLGRTPEELAEAGVTSAGAATLTVTMSLFGQVSDSAELDLTSGEASSASLAVEYSRSQSLVFGLAAVAALGMLAAVAMIVSALVRRRR